MRFPIRIFRYKRSHGAMAPGVPGCIAAGDSVEEMRKLIAKALELHLDLMRKNSERLPRPTKRLDLNIDDLEEGELCTWIEVRVRQPA